MTLLCDKYPELAKEWCTELNNGLLFSDTVLRVNTKYWWKCSLDHIYQSTVSHRIAGTGCPYCAGKKVLVGFNDLKTRSPAIAAQWCSELNGSLSPESVTVKSGKKVWWQCSSNHRYLSTVARRTSGSGCPYCSGRYAISGENDLETIYPNIAREWNYKLNQSLLPSQVLPNSNKKVWWTCEKGHDYLTDPSHRLRGRGCPYCSNRKVLKGFNDLETCLPDLAKEWHPTKNGGLLPSMVTPYGDTVIWWQCSVCGYEWKVSLNGRRGCPKCSSKRQTSFPEQAIYYYVKQAFPDAINRFKYKGYEFDVYVPSINTAIEYDGVYYHKTKRSTKKDDTKDYLTSSDGIRLIRIRDPQLNKTPSATIIPCKDTIRDGHLENALIELFKILKPDFNPDIDIQRDSVIILAMVQKYYKDKSISDLYKDIASEWNYEKNYPLIPQNITPGANIKVWWKCRQGHEWEATVNSRTRGCGCPFCSNRKCISGVNDLQTLRPEIAAEWDYEKNGDLTPDCVSSKSNKRVWWKCSICGNEWITSVNNRREPYCKRCSYKLFGIKKTKASAKNDNSLSVLYPDKAAQWNYELNGDLTPDEVSGRSGKMVWWICEKGHIWKSSIFNRTRDDLGCPVCSNQKVQVGVNDLATINPELAEEWNYYKNGSLMPTDIVPGSGKTVWWKCKKCGNEWEAIIRLRNKGWETCPICNPSSKLRSAKKITPL